MQLEDFIGPWRLTRQIQQADGQSARFEGEARWEPRPGGALYVESGTLLMPGGRFHAERRYLWEADLTVRFEDGRYFHRVPPEGGETGHWCDPDQYDAAYEFTDWPLWSCRWRVRGPRKDYEMQSRYSRA